MKAKSNPGIDREEKRPDSRWTMKARQNWDDIDPDMVEDHPDKMHVPQHMIPEGMDMRWVTDTVLGKPFAEWRASAEKTGWTPVHPEDFDGRFDGVFTPKGAKGEIRLDGSCLMARPLELSIRAKNRDRRAALEQVAIKEQALTGGEINTSLDSRHESALRSNKIRKSYERINIPE